MTFMTTIKQLRDDASLSQQDVADKIGVARATYAGLESGRRDPNLSELRHLADYYQIPINELIDGVKETVNEPAIPYIYADKKADIIPRDLNPQVKPEKLREVLLYILEKVGAKPNVGETVLYKLLYFTDFDYYEKTGQSITGLSYIRNHYGPTPAIKFAEIVKAMERDKELEIVETKFFNNTQRKYLPTKSANLHALSAVELTHINDTLARLSDKSATELSELSHHDMPWLVAKQSQKINYRDVFYRTDMTAVTEPEGEL
jgi:transcriptional regulator with XRE-family HTH domain